MYGTLEALQDVKQVLAKRLVVHVRDYRCKQLVRIVSSFQTGGLTRAVYPEHPEAEQGSQQIGAGRYRDASVSLLFQQVFGIHLSDRQR